MSSAPITTEILIVGAGVLGLCTAVELTRRGRDVLMLDPGGPNASSIAAGMIAPALEAGLDDASPDRADLLRHARTLWDAFAADLSIDLRLGPARWIGADGDVLAARLIALGFEVDRGIDGLSVALDAQIDPEPALAAMVAALDRPIRQGRASTVQATADGWRVQCQAGDGEAIQIAARTLVLATGAAAALSGLPVSVADHLARIEPVRGQIGWIPGRACRGVARTQGAYVAPSRGGTLVGATMEPGRRDLIPATEAGARLLKAAAPLLGAGPVSEVLWRVGIRGSTPDGLPMAGPSGVPGLHLALAPRRNGWLLGPLVARVVADGVAGADTGAAGAAFDPRRFASLRIGETIP